MCYIMYYIRREVLILCTLQNENENEGLKALTDEFNRVSSSTAQFLMTNFHFIRSVPEEFWNGSNLRIGKQK